MKTEGRRRTEPRQVAKECLVQTETYPEQKEQRRMTERESKSEMGTERVMSADRDTIRLMARARETDQETDAGRAK